VARQRQQRPGRQGGARRLARHQKGV
jgi:hypothetical protein